MSTYKLPENLSTRLILAVRPGESDENHSTFELIKDAMKAWAWLSDPDNTEEPEPIDPNDEEARHIADHFITSSNAEVGFVSPNWRVVSVNTFHKKCHQHKTKADVNRILDTLQKIGIVGASTQEIKTGGRSREIRYLLRHWIVEEDCVPFSEIEEIVFDELLALLVVAAPVKPVTSLRVLRDFPVSIASSFFQLTAGQILDAVDDYQLCRYLLDINAPVTEIEDDNSAQCADLRCAAMFKLSECPKPSNTVLICLADYRGVFNGSTILRKKGDLESDFFLTKYLLASKAPFAIARPDEFIVCPKCKSTTRREALLGDIERTIRMAKAG